MGADLDRKFYDRTDHFSKEALAGSLSEISSYFYRYQEPLQRFLHERRSVRAVELGAGTCCLSLQLSKFPEIESITALDISTAKMQTLLPMSQAQIGGDVTKITVAQADIGAKLPIDDHSADLVVADASIHHSRSIWNTLLEARRILKPDGLFIAQREQFLALLSFGFALNRLLMSPEVAQGVSENAYLRKQYEFYFRACGFTPRFIPFSSPLLRPLNGLVFSKWIIWARPKSAA